MEIRSPTQAYVAENVLLDARLALFHEREKWLAEHHAFSADLVEIGGKKFEPNNKADARRIKELIETAQADFARRPQTAE